MKQKGESGQNLAEMGEERGVFAQIREKNSDLGSIEIPELTLPKGGGALRGIDEKFTVNAANGTASMTIALPLTAGRDGFTPKLALGYSSGAGNGVFGLGWSLGLSAIQRKTDTGLPRYLSGPEEDIFTIAGGEDMVPHLIEAAPGDWQPDERIDGPLRITRYTPRVLGDFSRIERIDDPVRGIFWKVTDRANTVTIYGHTPAARLTDPEDPRRVFTWFPEFSHDNRGNWIAYDYRAEDLVGMPAASAETNRRSGLARFAGMHLKRVRYGNRTPWFPDPLIPYGPPAPGDGFCYFEVVFDYGEHDAARPAPTAAAGRDWAYRADAFSSYRAGFEIRTARLCQRVLMFHHFPDEDLGQAALVRSLDLQHLPVSLNGVGQAAACLLVSAEQAGYVRRGDASYARKAIPPLEFTYQPIAWDMRQHDVASDDMVDAPVGLTTPYRLVDLFGEGVSGILCDAGNSWIYKRNRGRDAVTGKPRFERGQRLATRPNLSGLAQSRATIEDLDASGQKQVVVSAPQLGGFFQLDATGAWEPFRAFSQATNLDLHDPSIRRIDLTGDGRLSILLTEDEAMVWYASRGKEGFAPAERVLRAFDEENGPAVVFAEAELSIFMADMSGDGLSDIVRIRNGDVSYWPNLGYGRFGRRVAMSAAPLFDQPDRFAPGRIRMADLTGTGPIDLIYLGGDGARAWLNQAGNGWSDPVEIPGLRPVDSWHRLEVADIFGQGTPCFVWSAATPEGADVPMRYIDPMGGRKPHLLTGCINNMGKETRIDYRPSSVDYLRDRAAGLDWATRLPFPVQVVEHHEIRDRISGARLVSRFTYHHGHWDTEEREFRGFARVDRIDTEDYESWKEGAPDGPLAVTQDQFQAPVLTRTWYNIGAWNAAGRLQTALAREYWPAAHDRAFPAQALGLAEPSLPEGRLVAARAIVDPAAIARLSPAERREAERACKGLVLRQEVFALDAPATGATDQQRRHAMLPFTVDTHSCHIRLAQPRGPNPHAVFLVVEDEALSLNYERNPADPRISHALNLEIDDLGNVLEAAQLSYGRDPVAAAAATGIINASATDFASFAEQTILSAALTDALDRAEATQTRTWVTLDRTRYTNDIDTAADWRTRVPCESESFEITGLTPATRLFTLADLRGVLDDLRSTEIPYHAAPLGGIARRRIQHGVSRYYDAGLTAPLPIGQIAAHGIAHQSMTKALTPALLTYLFGTHLPNMPATEVRLLAAGYRHHDGDSDWWIPTGHIRYLDPGETITDARARFFKPRGHVDPFGSETLVTYHKGYFLLLDSTTDTAGNTVRVEAFDFRAMAPVRLRDPNDNLSAIVFDELARVTAQAFLGKDLDGDGVPELQLADDLAGQDADSTADATAVAALLSATDSQVLNPLARQLLRHASLRFAYDLDAYRARGQPAAAATILRTRHHADDPNPELHLIFDFTDGSGALAMTKTQAEPGQAISATQNPDGSVTVTTTDTATLVPPRLRWVGTGRTVLNNKANPIRKYEPYFALTPQYESLPELVATGVSATLTYDALGRLIRNDMPDGTFLRTAFDPWVVQSFDPGDTVAESRWHADRVGRRIDAALLAQGRDPAREAEAAVAAAAAYAGTPSRVVLDSLARPVLSIDHNGFDAGGRAILFATTIARDVEGNVREVIDARGNRPIAYANDMLGRRLVQTNMDSGRRQVLQTVTGHPFVKWDDRGHEMQFSYDGMQRPLLQRIIGGDGPAPLDHIVMRAEYGEGGPNDRLHSLRGRMVRRWDGGGLEEWRRFDGKGNLLESSRRFARDYRMTVNWTGNLVAPLETETHVTRQEVDALGRLVRVTAADGSTVQKFYSAANLLSRQVATTAGQQAEEIVAAILHDAKGQRLRTTLGNGTRIDYRYDPLTFRLLGITSTTSGGRAVQDIAYTHDCAGNLTHREDRAQPAVYFSNIRVTALSRYGYDALYRLTSAEGREHAGQTGAGFGALDNWDEGAMTQVLAPGDVMAWRSYTETYQHDPVGNLRRLRHIAINGNFTRNYWYEAATNRLTRTEIGADTYGMDHHPTHGFVRAMPHLPVMVYNHRDELVATARQAFGGGTPETTWYVYDHDGHRIRKVTDNFAPGQAVPMPREERLYLGGIEIFRVHTGASSGLERHSLIFSDDLSRMAMIDLRNNVDDGTALRITRYQIASHLGSVALELDAAEQLLGYEEFHPFGTTAFRATGTTLAVAERRYRYSGMERDEESGLACHAARYYVPWIGRWLKPDPAGLSDGVNDCQYASGNPMRISDPSGLGGWDRFWGGVKMVGGALEAVAGGALVGAGVATSEIGVGIPIAAAGVAVTAHGLDVTASGARTMWNGEPVDTLTSQGLQELGMSRTAANLTDAGISVVGSLGSSAVATSGRVLTVAEGAAVAGDDAIQVVRGTEQATAAVATRTGNNLVHLSTAENTTAMVSAQTLGRGGTIYATQPGLAVASDAEVMLRTGLTGSQTTNALLIPERAAGAFQTPTVVGPMTAWQRLSGTVHSAGAGEINLATGAFTRTGAATNQIFIQAVDTATVTGALAAPALMLSRGSDAGPISATSSPDLEPAVAHAPLMSEPAAQNSSAPMQSSMPAAAAMSSYDEDARPSELVCTSEGYYDPQAQACYAY